jgi:hypothetical protein
MEVEEVIYQDTPATAWCAIWDGTFLYICDQYDLIIYDLFDNAGIKNAGNESVPGKYALLKSIAPNPFNSSIKINYEIPHSGRVKLAIYNIFGEEVEVLLNKNCSPGEYSQDFVGGEFSSGIYFVSLQFDGVRQMQKVVMVK